MWFSRSRPVRGGSVRSLRRSSPKGNPPGRGRYLHNDRGRGRRCERSRMVSTEKFKSTEVREQYLYMCFVFYCSVLYCTVVMFCIALFSFVLYSIVLYCFLLYSIVLHCIALYCFALYGILLYC